MTEQNELLEAALKLAETLKSIENKADWSMETQQALDAIEKHRPKPEAVEGWVTFDGHGCVTRVYPSRDALLAAWPNANRVLPVREVTPAQEWERWEINLVRPFVFKITCGGKPVLSELTQGEASRITNAHNAEMEKVTGTKGK